jgi:rhomboid protease gluP
MTIIGVRMYNENTKSVPIVTYVLIALNIIVFFVVEALGSTEDLSDMLLFGASYTPLILGKAQYWRLVSSIFLHFGIMHLSNNMVGLYVIGDQVERAIGSFKFIIIYIIAGVGANIISMFLRLKEEPVVSAGASGAIFGLAGSMLAIALKNRNKNSDISIARIVLMIGLMIYYGFTSSGVDNIAHISGAVIGFLCASVLA